MSNLIIISKEGIFKLKNTAKIDFYFVKIRPNLISKNNDKTVLQKVVQYYKIIIKEISTKMLELMISKGKIKRFRDGYEQPLGFSLSVWPKMETAALIETTGQ